MIYRNKHHVFPQCDHSYFQSNDQELSQLAPTCILYIEDNILVNISLSMYYEGSVTTSHPKQACNELDVAIIN